MSIFTKKKIYDFIIYGFGQAINLASPLLVMPILIYYCGEAGLGKVGVGFSIALILNGIVDYGSYINGVREISVNRENKVILEEKFKAIYLSKFFLLIAVLFVISVLIFLIPFLNKDKTLMFFSLSIVIGQFINPAWYFQGTENFKWISFTNILSKIIYIALILIFIKSKGDYIYANLFLGTGAIIANSIGLFWLIKQNTFNLKNLDTKPAFLILKEEFSFSLSQFFLSLYQFFPIVLISYIAGDYIAGQYRVIDQIVTIFKTYLNMIFYFVYSNICYELSKNYKNGLKVWKQYNGYNFILLFIIISVFYFNAEMIMGFFKVEQSQLLIMSGYFKIALLIPLLVGISQPLRQLMFAFNKNKIYILITIVSTILNLILLVLLTKQFKLQGAFFSIIIIEVIIIALYAIILSKKSESDIKI